jgi:hypothetical protein
MATNALDDDIMQFCENNEGIFDHDDVFKRELLLDDLTAVMKHKFKELFKVRYRIPNASSPAKYFFIYSPRLQDVSQHSYHSCHSRHQKPMWVPTNIYSS